MSLLVWRINWVNDFKSKNQLEFEDPWQKTCAYSLQKTPRPKCCKYSIWSHDMWNNQPMLVYSHNNL